MRDNTTGEAATVRAKILHALEHGEQMRAGELMRATGAAKCRMHSELARCVLRGLVTRIGEPPDSSYQIVRRHVDDWGDGGRELVYTGQRVADALANRTPLEVAWAKGRRRSRA
jgi:DNA-binding IclR family transcriptional regulator